MELFIHLQRSILLASASSLQELPTLHLSRQNHFPISLACCADGSTLAQPIAIIPIPAPYTRIILSARPADQLTGPDLLFYADNFTPTGTGSSLRYTTTLNTHTTTAEDLFASHPRATHPCLLDIDLLVSDDPAAGRRTIIRHRPFLFYRTLWTPGDPPPSPITSYPPPTAIPTLGTAYGDLRITSVGLELRDTVTGVWRRLSFHDGQLTFTEV